MISTKYKYALVDMSYIMMRNLAVISKGKKPGEFTEGDLMRICLQTINKIPRDFNITADKFIFIYDKWHKDYSGYFRTHLLRGVSQKYKGTRVYISKELAQEYVNNPESIPQEVKDYYKFKGKEGQELLDAIIHEGYTNEVKYKAKWGMVRDFKRLGIPCLGLDGWEYDDLAYLAGQLLYSEEEKPSVVITKDSDLQYSLTPKLDYFKIPTGGSEPKIITYSDMYYTIPDEIRERGVSLYKYKALLDSLGEGHNDMMKTKKDMADANKTILQILDGDFSGVDNVEAFKTQMKSFDISWFPNLQEAMNIVKTEFPTVGTLGSLSDFHNICENYGITGVGDGYFINFTRRFDPILFRER